MLQGALKYLGTDARLGFTHISSVTYVHDFRQTYKNRDLWTPHYFIIGIHHYSLFTRYYTVPAGQFKSSS